MQETKPLKQLIEEARESGLSVLDLSRRIDCSRMQIWRIIRGKCSEKGRVGRLLRSELERQQERPHSVSELAEILWQVTGGEPTRVRKTLHMLQILACLTRRAS